MFEEALVSVMTVRDFSQIWDAYTRFEDELIAAQMVIFIIIIIII